MPIQECQLSGSPGFKWGASGTCYTYNPASQSEKDGAKKRAIRQAIAAGATSKELEGELDPAGIRLLAEAQAELSTEDIGEVEVLAVGGPVKAIGSPPGGEYITADRLAQIAASTRSLEAELKPALKLGHSKEQRTLQEAGLFDGERPRAGRLTNFRLSADKTRLLADLGQVPRMVAGLIRAGAFSRLSAELKRDLTDQGADGQTHDLVVSDVALLGAKTPAVRTLRDVVALYQDQEAGDDLQATVDRKLAEPDAWSRFFELGDITDEGLALVPISTLHELAGKSERPADTRPTMPELTLTEENQRELAEALEVKPEELTPERLLEAVKNESGGGDGGDGGEGEGGDGGEGDGGDGGAEKSEAQRQLEARVEAAEKKAEETAEKLRLEERRYFVDDLVKGAKVEPGERKKWETYYDKDPELARSFAEDLKVQPELVREYGSDEEETTEEEQEQAERAYTEDAAARFDIPKEKVL